MFEAAFLFPIDFYGVNCRALNFPSSKAAHFIDLGLL